jgi:iron(III) transport system substrate-binding protein
MFPRPTSRAAVRVATVAVAALVAVGCGSDDNDSSSDGASADSGSKDALVVYSGREKELVEPLYEQFEEASGIDLEVRYADSASMAAQLQEEGENSPADVFYAQDAGAIGSIEPLLAELPAELVADVPAKYRDREGRWTGVTGRVRTLVYNTDELEESELPKTVFGVLEPEWKGRVAVAPTNASFIAFITAMRLELGEDRAKEFLEGLVANDAKIYEKNGPIVDAVGAGEVEVGLVNHYYLWERLEDDPELPIANHFFAPNDIGNLVNTSAIGILATAEHREEAEQLVEFMLTEGQEFIVNEAPEREYPLSVTTDIADNERYQELPALEGIKAPDVDLSDLGAELEATVDLIRESGLGS